MTTTTNNVLIFKPRQQTKNTSKKISSSKIESKDIHDTSHFYDVTVINGCKPDVKFIIVKEPTFLESKNDFEFDPFPDSPRYA